MPLAISIFPIWCALANPMHSTKIDMFIGDIFIITSAIIISTMDIQGVHTNNIAIMLIIQRFSAKQFNAFFFKHFGTIFLSIILMKDIKKMKRMRQTQFHFFVVFFYKLTSAKPRIKKIRLQDLKIYLQ